MENIDGTLFTDWWEWHRGYDEPGSRLQVRTEVVHRHIGAFLDKREPGARIRIVSICAGQGRELLPVIAAHPRKVDVSARLIELDPRNVAAACDLVEELRLDWYVEIVCGDASVTDAYAGAVPADLVLLCGVFGCLPSADVQATIERLPELCAPEATIVWAHQPLEAALGLEIRRWFEESGFAEEAFDSPCADTSAVGVHRLIAPPRPLVRGVRLFTYPKEAHHARTHP
jgi:Putative methyltransferase